MKPFTALLSVTSLAAVALAQRANIGAPPDMTSVTPGSSLTVRIDRPSFLSGDSDQQLWIGVFPCGSSPCPGAAQVLGTILYSGPFNPQGASGSQIPPLPPNQNFTVTIPDWVPQGNLQLGVAHFSLVGASNVPLFETFNETLRVV